MNSSTSPEPSPKKLAEYDREDSINEFHIKKMKRFNEKNATFATPSQFSFDSRTSETERKDLSKANGSKCGSYVTTLDKDVKAKNQVEENYFADEVTVARYKQI